jgi:hypothetical protein
MSAPFYSPDFLMPKPAGFNYIDSLAELNNPNPLQVPNSPNGGGGEMAAPFQFRNPYGWVSFGEGLPADASFGQKLGNFMGGNAQTFGTYADLIGKGLGAYTGLKGLSLATDALNLEKRRFRTNLANQTSSYNTQMRDRIDGRQYATQADREAAYAAAVLPTTPDKKKKMGMGG